ncbi:MAG: hypothetical protein BYD32DRAFT_470790 [Podila humilis]|nr:MAG: hypothetical protein BYD32DRAFT_470790 [Podila humilis]
MDRLDMAGIMVLADGKNREQIQKHFHTLEQKVLKWSDQNICLNMFYGEQTKWDYATSTLFFVLPSDLDSWRDADTSTHQFRLYFLCDNRKEDFTFSRMPQYVHLFDHPGYNLLDPQIFLEEYGDYALRVLQMLKNGCPIAIYEIPPIDSGKILWRCDPAITSSHFTKETFALLVDKAITHIQGLSLPKWTMNPWLTRNQSAAIKDFLDVKEDENTEGNLHRHIDSDQRVSWKCEWHKQQHIEPKPLATLQEFVRNHGGDLNMQQTTLTAVLRSSSVADQFRTLLKGTQQIFNLNLRLDLRPTREYLRDLILDLAQSKAVILDIDGVTLETHPLGYVDYALNLFADNVVPKSDLKLITLINYPRPQERCLHLGKFSLRTTISTSRPARSWVELRSELEKFGDMVSLARTGIDCNNAAEMLRSLLKKHGYPLATVVTIHESGWNTVFKPEEGGVIEVYSKDAACPLGVHFSGSLRKVTVELGDLNFDPDFFHLAQTNKALQELNVSYGGSNLLYYIESIVKMWHDSSSPFTLTLIDRMGDSRGRVVAQMTIRGRGSDGSGSTLNVDRVDSMHSTQKGAPIPPNVHFSKYDSDHIFSPLSDFSASILDKATEQHPSVLNLLSLDTSQLSSDGLAAASKILGRSDLEHLNIVCTPFNSDLSGSMEQVLDSVQSNALKSLVLSGSNIDGWIKLWPSNDTPKLIHLGIRGTGSAQQELSHESVLVVHQMVYASPLVDLKFENVELQHKRDWELIVGGLDPKSLKTFGLCERSRAQFDSSPEAVVLFNEKFPGKPNRQAAENKAPAVKIKKDQEPSKVTTTKDTDQEPNKVSASKDGVAQQQKPKQSEPSCWRRLFCCWCDRVKKEKKEKKEKK